MIELKLDPIATGSHAIRPQEQAIRNLLAAMLLQRFSDIESTYPAGATTPTARDRIHAEAVEFFERGHHEYASRLLGYRPGAVLATARRLNQQRTLRERRDAQSMWVRLSDEERGQVSAAVVVKVEAAGSIAALARALGIHREVLRGLYHGERGTARQAVLELLGVGHLGTPCVRGSIPPADNPISKRVDLAGAHYGTFQRLADQMGYSRHMVEMVRHGRQASDRFRRRLAEAEDKIRKEMTA